MPPHVQVEHNDELQQESSALSRQCMPLNDINSSSEQQSPLFQDDISILAARRSASPLDALRSDDASIYEVDPLPSKPKIRRVSGIEAIIGSESRYVQNESAGSNNPPSSASTVATASTTSSSAPPTLNNGSKKTSKNNKVKNVLFPKDSKQRRKKIAGFFRKGKKIASSIVKRKSKRNS